MLRGKGQTSMQSHGAHTPLILSLQTQMWWQTQCTWQRPMSSGYWMNEPQYCTEWAHSHIEAGLLFKSSGQSHSMCTSPLRHGEQWDACTRPLLAYCGAGLSRPLGCLIKSETITFSGLSGRVACKKKKRATTPITPPPPLLLSTTIANALQKKYVSNGSIAFNFFTIVEEAWLRKG